MHCLHTVRTPLPLVVSEVIPLSPISVDSGPYIVNKDRDRVDLCAISG